MADIQANIGIGVDTSQALAAIRQLQREISVFHTLMAKGGAAAAAKSMAMQQGLINTINETGKFSASMTRISSSTESFTNALEKNKLSMTQYFRYAGGASKTFGKMFTREFNTINKVATERVKDLQTQYISMGRDANGALQSIKVRPLALDMDNLGTKVQLAAQKQQIFNQLMKQGTTNLLNFGKNTQWAGRQLMVGFTIPLTIFGATAAREFQKLEEQAVKFRRVYGDMFTTDADTEKALANVRQLAEEFTKYGIAVEKTIGLAAKVAQMGNVGEDLTEQVTQATRLAVLGGLEQEQALDTTISLTNAFGIAAEDLAGKIAFLNAAENQTILSIEDFNEAIPKAGSVVQQLGGDVEDLAFFLTAMREGGINASQGANALKTSLARLIAPTEVAKKEMAAFGIDIVGIVEQNAGNLRQTVIELGQQLDTLDPLNRARAIEQLFGKFQFARMSTMFQNIAKEGSQANKVLELTTNSMEELAIVAERELKAVEESPAFRLQKQMEQLKASLAPIGEEFIKAVGPLIEFGTKLLKSFNNLGDGGKQFIVILTTVAGVVAPAALMAFGLIANGVANLLKFFLFLGNAFGRLSGQSTMLGGQTEYMTQQQLEAAAVAASLGQSHSNLTQIFTAEASAISGLVAQYRAAITAQRQLSIGQTARGVAARPPGFAKGGIIRGPGTGTSDSIMAMISDGEAIIPAEQVKRYGAVVEQLISGNIPGYAEGRTQSGRRSYGPNELPIYGEYMGRFEPRVANQSGLAGVPRPIDVGAPLAMRTAEARGMPTTPRSVGANPGPYQEILAQQSEMVTKFVQRLNSHLETTYADIENSTQQMSLAWKAAGQDVQQEVSQISDPKERLVAERTFGIQEDFYSTIPTAARNPGETQPTSERASAFLPSKTGIKSYRDNSRSAKVLAEIETGENFAGYDFGHAGTSKVTTLQDIARDETAGTAVVRAGRVKGQNIDLAQIQAEGTATFNSLGSNLVNSAEDGWRTAAQQNSPSKKFFGLGSGAADSLADGFQQGMADETGKPPLPGNLAAPKPPVTSGYTPSRAERLRARFNDSAIGQGIGKKLSGITGNALTDSQGNVTYDPGAVAGGVTPVRVVNEVEFDPALQQTLEDGNIKSENLMDTMDQNRKVQEVQISQDKAAIKEDRRQKRQARAGKALAGLGTLTMAAGMATQVEGKVGELAQQAVGPLAVLSGVAPLLMALPAPIAAAVAALGIFGYTIYQNIKAQEKMREESKQLADTFSSGRDAINKFAEFAGTATAAQIQDRKRQAQGEVFQIEPGKTTFGQSFVASEDGEEFVSQIELGIARLGRSDAIQRFSNQLSSAVISGALDFSQAKSIASAIGAAMEDRSFGISVTGDLVKLFGPDGENILENPLSLTMAFQQNLENTSARTMADLTAPEISGEDIRARAVQLASDFELNPIGFIENALAGFNEEAVIRNRVNSKKYTDLARDSLETETQEFARQDLIDLIQFNSDALDSITTQYEKAYNEAQEAGDISKMVELREQYVQTRQNFSDASVRAFTDLTSQFDTSDLATQDEMLKSSRESILAGISDEEVKTQTDVGLGRLGSREGVTREIEFRINTLLESGQINPETFNKLIADPATDFSMVADIGAKYGPNAQQILNQISSLENDEIRGTVTAQFAAEDTTVAGGLSLFDMLNNAADIGLLFPDKAGVLVSFFAENQDLGAMIDENVKEIQNVVDSGEPITLDVVQRVYAENPEVVAAVKADQEAFEAMSPQDQVEFLQSVDIIYTVKATGEPWLLQLLRDEAGIGPDGVLTPETEQETIVDLGQRFTRIKTPDLTGDNNDDDDTPVGSGAEPQIDSLITKLRDLRDATVSMKKGWEGMQETLNSIFAGGANQMGMFNGLEKQIRSLGIGEGLIAQIVGMDPDEYEKRKNELFEFDGLGNIVKAKGALLNMNEAFNAVAIGEYVNGQEKFIQKTRNQISSISILTANGMSLADAYDAVQDEALAAAVAMGATREEIEEILRVTQLAKELEEDLEEQRERSRISEAVRKTNEEFSNQVAILQKLSKAQGQYSDEQVKAIMGDSDLQKLFLDPSIDPKALEAALRNAEEKANLEVQIAIAEGREDELFGQYLTEVNDYFSREEAVIGVNFEMDTADESKIIEDAQRQIDAIQYQLDDYNAELEQISWSEEDINEKYDKRIEALDEISDANEKIANQQKAQLDIADALSKGDIAAAARATAELRSQQASDAQQSQKEQLDRAREAELKQLTGPSGMTREQLEDAITSLERQVFQLEETALEPAQERVRLAEITRDLAIEQLELNGMTRDEFDQIAASTNLAALNMEDMVKSAEKLVAMGEFIRTGTKPSNWEKLFPTPKAAPAPAPARSSGGGGGGSAPTGKSNWVDTSTGKTLGQLAAESGKHWTTYYNENRGLDKSLTPAASGGLIGMAMGGLAKKSRSGPPLQMAMGGKVKRYANGGMIIPKRMAMGGYSMGSDIVPAILTPGEFVVRRPAVSAFGVDNLEKINRGTYNDGSVYNYNLAVNVKSDSDPNRIARAVITNIKSIENQRIRGNKL